MILLALALLGLQVWMFGRFFVNVLFWQQFAVLENAGVIESLRESRNLARSGRELPWFQRPIWRGVFIASLWFAFVLAIALVSEWTTLQHSFNELMTTQDPQTLLQKLTEAQQARGFDVLTFALGILQKILQPLIGIAFVLLYIDSRKRAVELPLHRAARLALHQLRHDGIRSIHLSAPQEKLRNLAEVTANISKISDKRDELSADQPNVTAASNEQIRPDPNRERAGEVEEKSKGTST